MTLRKGLRAWLGVAMASMLWSSDQEPQKRKSVPTTPTHSRPPFMPHGWAEKKPGKSGKRPCMGPACNKLHNHNNAFCSSECCTAYRKAKKQQ